MTQPTPAKRPAPPPDPHALACARLDKAARRLVTWALEAKRTPEDIGHEGLPLVVELQGARQQMRDTRPQRPANKAASE